jgi:hypothetical protein
VWIRVENISKETIESKLADTGIKIITLSSSFFVVSHTSDIKNVSLFQLSEEILRVYFKRIKYQ